MSDEDALRVHTYDELVAALGPLTPEEIAVLKEIDDGVYFDSHPITPEEHERAEQTSRLALRLLRFHRLGLGGGSKQ